MYARYVRYVVYISSFAWNIVTVFGKTDRLVRKTKFVFNCFVTFYSSEEANPMLRLGVRCASVSEARTTISVCI